MSLNTGYTAQVCIDNICSIVCPIYIQFNFEECSDSYSETRDEKNCDEKNCDESLPSAWIDTGIMWQQRLHLFFVLELTKPGNESIMDR